MQGPYELSKVADKTKFIKSRFSLKTKAVIETKEVADKSVEKIPEEMNKDRKELNLQTRNKKFMCVHCQKKFRRNYHLKRHIKTVHKDIYPYECTVCGELLKTIISFESHVTLHQIDSSLFCCADCDFKSVDASNFRRHQREQHADIYIFRCQFCTELFKNKTIFLKHMKHHNTAATSNVCGQECKDDSHLPQSKLKLQDNKKYIHEQSQQEQCQGDEKYTMEINKSENLDLQEYSNERSDQLDNNLNLLKDKRVFKCPKCRWRFKTTKLLKKHMKRHLIFTCDKCDAVFKYKASFLNHKHKHKNESSHFELESAILL
ncbi:PR domain zinc finger protein 15-like [Pogonomyrmex barbatus]|uniref:PR domain zinc finger protein 15-like n=1 Tax=Pogonomyrmex barbatus TaxID=144034 RepID=A0A8N1S4G3_9HYME|nr:PR domain zinc finger protein 15-like [Pogonomyrmex barbatus]